MQRISKFTILVVLLLSFSVVQADWQETNKDGTPGGGLDYLNYWVAAWNGPDTENPGTTWETATNLGNAGFGFDAGWVDNVVNIEDEDSTSYAAQNQYESFTNVRATVSVSTVDLDEEFGLIVRADTFAMGDPFTNVTAYAATFNANNATSIGSPTEFKLYKIVNGEIKHTETANPLVPASLNDFISFIELSVEGNYVRARLFEDADSATPVADIDYTDLYGDADGDPLLSGYTGVINLEGSTSDGLMSYYDTLSSVVIPEPSAMILLALGGVGFLRRLKKK
ncbi:MAG: PEP-CTERM sorting domain-containing protein [Sedimentisphaerales bacterium]|nr:PEP-CTERM sorting domain-containing protein [Sedimentisphaerales bacterium]